ncbi:hypothetical protein D3C85_322510 [compost metagenome]
MKDLSYYTAVLVGFFMSFLHVINDFIQFFILIITLIVSLVKLKSTLEERKKNEK